MHEKASILDVLMDENVLYTLSIVAVSSIATIGAIFVGYKVIIRKKEDSLSASPAKTGSGEGKKKAKSMKNEADKPIVGDDKSLRKLAGNDKGDNDSDGDEVTDDDEPPALIPANADGTERDPFEYCEHIQGEVKKIRQNLATKKIEESMSQAQINEEREAQRKQMEAIFSMMAEENDKFGVQSMDDIQRQMNLYV